MEKNMKNLFDLEGKVAHKKALWANLKEINIDFEIFS